MVVLVLIDPTCLMRSAFTVHMVLDIVDERLATGRENSEMLRFLHALHSVTPEEEP